MEIILPIIIVLAVVGTMVYLQEKRLKKLSEDLKPDESILEWLKSQQIQQQQASENFNKTLQLTNKNIQQVLHQNTSALNKRLDNAAKYISEVAKEVGQMSEIGRSMRELQDFLKSPKLRGNIGEQVLNDLISQMFPKNSFHFQFSFKSGEKVDAALKTDAGILPIDSKFPMENFRKFASAKSESEKKVFKKNFINDVRKHIRDIAQKYILPDEGTVNFAFMYVPSEAVYYEVVNEPELFEYARKLRVYVVSPSTMYAALQTILLSFEGKKIEAQARQVFRLLHGIQQEYQKTESELTILQKHITNAASKINDVFQRFTGLGQKITSANSLPQPKEKKLIEEN